MFRSKVRWDLYLFCGIHACNCLERNSHFLGQPKILEKKIYFFLLGHIGRRSGVSPVSELRNRSYQVWGIFCPKYIHFQCLQAYFQKRKGNTQGISLIQWDVYSSLGLNWCIITAPRIRCKIKWVYFSIPSRYNLHHFYKSNANHSLKVMVVQMG